MKTILMFFLLAVTVLAQPANPFLRENAEPIPFMVIGHRGARAYAPENTLSSFQKAIDLGVSMYELDVHLSKDGKLVVVHDDTLSRCSDVAKKFPGRVPYFVSDFTLEEMKTLDAGSWFVAEIEKPASERQSYLREMTEKERLEFITEKDLEYYRSGTVTIPTLKEALLLAKKRDCFVNVEIKNIPRFYPGISCKVVGVIEQTKMVSRVIISCFDHNQVALCKKLCPKVATAVLCSSRIFRPGEYCGKVGADTYHPRYTSLEVGPYSLSAKKREFCEETIKNARDMGVRVFTWTVNDPRCMEVLIKSGVNGIFTDYPNRLMQVVNHLSMSKKNE